MGLCQWWQRGTPLIEKHRSPYAYSYTPNAITKF